MHFRFSSSHCDAVAFLSPSAPVQCVSFPFYAVAEHNISLPALTYSVPLRFKSAPCLCQAMRFRCKALLVQSTSTPSKSTAMQSYAYAFPPLLPSLRHRRVGSGLSRRHCKPILAGRIGGRYARSAGQMEDGELHPMKPTASEKKPRDTGCQNQMPSDGH